MVLGQNKAVLDSSEICSQKIYGLHGLNHQIIEYWVRRGRHWLVLGGTWSEQGGSGCLYDMLSENIWFASSLNHQIIEYSKKETDLRFVGTARTGGPVKFFLTV